MDVNIIVSETIREDDGLAMSSRNAYLTVEERRAAPIVYQSLRAALHLYHGVRNDGESISSDELRQAVVAVLSSEPLVSNIQYVSVDDKANMRPIDRVYKGEGAVISLACQVGHVRLIDNIIL